MPPKGREAGVSVEQLDAGEGVALDEVLDEADAIIADARSRRRAKAG